MHLQRGCPAGIRFLASVKDGRGIKPSARAAGVGKETGYRWLRESFTALREQGLNAVAAQAELGFHSPMVLEWDAARVVGERRHHLAVDAAIEGAFWRSFLGGADLPAACVSAGVGRSTGYRWWRARFELLRQEGVPVWTAAGELKLSSGRARAWEAQRRRVAGLAAVARDAAERRAVRESARYAQALIQGRGARSEVQGRDTLYGELMRSGLSNTAACKLLGVNRRTGTLIRQRHRHQSATPTMKQQLSTGRYLSLPERLQIADLLSLGLSMRAIAAELGRSPSTVKRELDRHRDAAGRYLPRGADHTAKLARRRAPEHNLVANTKLRLLVQRKLNRCWSPDEISGWLRLTHPDAQSMQLCPETIYRALLVPGGQGLHKRYCRKLRTGRRVRRSRCLPRNGHGSTVQNMPMINERPAEVEDRREAGHWEGDLVIGVGNRSAMMTLRERKTHFGIIVNLPNDHTAHSVNAAATAAFATMPPHMRRTLTWDQGVEMARHRELAAATGVKIYFAERSSPWQRGANENFNGLIRQYFPKGTDLSVHSARHVAAVMLELNTRPRRTLGYLTPEARFRTESHTAT